MSMQHLTRREIEREHSIMLAALTTIARGAEFVNGQPRMNGTFEQHPKLVSWKRMTEIAQEALEELE